MEEILRVLPNETEDQCLFRIGEAKKNGLLDVYWQDIADFMNATFREDETKYYSESAYRKKFKNYIDAKELSVFNSDLSMDEELVEKKRELEKERIKLRDERLDLQRSLRESARKESFVELVERAMKNNIASFDYKPSLIIDSDEDMIVCLSDLHIGLCVDNWWNVYNEDVLKSRLEKYLNEINSIQNTHKCKVCHVVLGGDLISGLIHQNLRLQNNENVIEQVKMAVEFIGRFIYTLADWFETVNVYGVSGNHSRISPNKEEHLKGEELDELILFCLNLKFVNNNNINIRCGKENCIDSTITTFKTRGGKVFYAVHGDKDSVQNVVKNLTLMSGKKPDAIIMGHRHHNAFDTDYNVKIIQCGCLSGMDDYCIEKRILGSPEQSVFITSKNKTIKCLYDIILN